jgi:hypothetical protein
MDGWVLFGVVCWVIFMTAVGGVIGQSKGRTFLGFSLGLFLNLLGAIIIALLPATDAAINRRFAMQAKAIKNEMNDVSSDTSTIKTERVSREDVMAIALRQYPELAEDNSPEGLSRLAAVVSDLEAAERLKSERDAAVAKEQLRTAQIRLAEAQKLENEEREQAAKRQAEREAQRIEQLGPFRKWISRNPMLVGLAVVILLVTLVVGAVIAAGSFLTNRSEEAAKQLIEENLDFIISNPNTCVNNFVSEICDFSGVNLFGRDFQQAVLAGVVFDGSDLTGANLTGANLNKASLIRANLNRAVLDGSDLSFSDTTGAKTVGTSAIETNWVAALCPSGFPSGGLDCL